MATTYSIAEARNQFAALVRDAEESKQPVQVTRHGQPVAVILSAEEYGRLLANQPSRNFWAAYQEWRQNWSTSELDINPDEIWGDVRDRTPAPESDPWQ
ncbi:MAG: type II toxin-antitoxin system Phd/YefM family antitoxin [Candidatus Promineifilaceae bacterium]|nr:type II toxin-antitoxin system Phd/YefM family antitoxin [Anaerolineaceae bacterium]